MQSVTESRVEIEQFSDGIVLRPTDSENQWRYTPGDIVAPLLLCVNICCLIDQLLDAVYMTILCCAVQRRRPSLIPVLGVGAVLDERPDGLEVPLLRARQQRREVSSIGDSSHWNPLRARVAS